MAQLYGGEISVISAREELREFHFTNHLAVSATTPEELRAQEADLPNDFPHLLDDTLFVRGLYWGTRDAGGALTGCIGLNPDESDPAVVWLTAFSVAPDARRRGLGRRLLHTALAAARSRWRTVRLVTLANRMQVALAMYERAGFATTSTMTTESYEIHFMELT